MSLWKSIGRGVGYPLAAVLALALFPLTAAVAVGTNYRGAATQVASLPGVSADGGLRSGLLVGVFATGALAVVVAPGVLVFSDGGLESVSPGVTDGSETTTSTAIVKPSTATSTQSTRTSTSTETPSRTPTVTPTQTPSPTRAPTPPPTPVATPTPTMSVTVTSTVSSTASPTRDLTTEEELQWFKRAFVKSLKNNKGIHPTHSRIRDNILYIKYSSTENRSKIGSTIGKTVSTHASMMRDFNETKPSHVSVTITNTSGDQIGKYHIKSEWSRQYLQKEISKSELVDRVIDTLRLEKNID